MSLRLYEERVAQIKATADTEAESLRAEKERLADIERREIDAVTHAREAAERAELAEATVASLRQEIATTNAVLIERAAELEAAKRGSITVKSLDVHFERIELIVAENAGPAPTRALKQQPRREHEMADEKVPLGPKPVIPPNAPGWSGNPDRNPNTRPMPSRTDPSADKRR
jgi:hypothetical protein